MKKLDRLFDTYPKRMAMVYTLLVVLLLYFGYQNCVLGSMMYRLEQFNDIYQLLENPIVETTIIGRGILAFLNYTNTSFGWIKVMIHVLDFWHLLFLVLLFLYLDNGLLSRVFCWSRIHLTISFAIQFLFLIFVFIIGGAALQSGTTSIALSLIQKTGCWFYWIQVVLIVVHICCYFLFVYHFE
ncbi:MAG: hypothetical protein PUF50_03320 [Erysipelotrichaceae bacterium]|nr:hypothetical protein [Erysipelotrichaceae bacterium]